MLKHLIYEQWTKKVTNLVSVKPCKSEFFFNFTLYSQIVNLILKLVFKHQSTAIFLLLELGNKMLSNSLWTLHQV